LAKPNDKAMHGTNRSGRRHLLSAVMPRTLPFRVHRFMRGSPRKAAQRPAATRAINPRGPNEPSDLRAFVVKKCVASAKPGPSAWGTSGDDRILNVCRLFFTTKARSSEGIHDTHRVVASPQGFIARLHGSRVATRTSIGRKADVRRQNFPAASWSVFALSTDCRRRDRTAERSGRGENRSRCAGDTADAWGERNKAKARCCPKAQ
jgi:hypothetical protein